MLRKLALTLLALSAFASNASAQPSCNPSQGDLKKAVECLARKVQGLESSLRRAIVVFERHHCPEGWIALEEAKAFEHYRNKLKKRFPRFGERYESNNRYKITVHSLRSFTATQCAEVIDEDFGHTVIGHSKYLSQYIRNKEKIPALYLKCEHNLMVFEKIEVVDSDEKVKSMQDDIDKLQKMVLIIQNSREKSL